MTNPRRAHDVSQLREFRTLCAEYGWDLVGDPVVWMRRKLESLTGDSSKDRRMMLPSGTTPHRDRCVRCGRPMMHRVSRRDAPHVMFCSNQQCPEWQREIPVP